MGEDKALTHCRSRKNRGKWPFINVIRSEALKHETKVLFLSSLTT